MYIFVCIYVYIKLSRCCWCWPCGWWKCWLWWYVAWKGCSPFHFEPCFSYPVVSLDDSFLLLLVEVLICFFNDLCVVVWSLCDCPAVVLQSFCWNWTSAVWHEKCLALCSVDSYQETLGCWMSTDRSCFEGSPCLLVWVWLVPLLLLFLLLFDWPQASCWLAVLPV